MSTPTRLPRVQRREQILAAATRTFARLGFSATSLDDVAAEAGVSRVILYRHFESKSDLYRAALDRYCSVLGQHLHEPRGGFSDASVDGLIAAATADPSGYKLLFVHSAREPEFSGLSEHFRSQITAIAHRQIAGVVSDPAWAAWAAALAPTVAIEAINAWLDAGQPNPDRAPMRVRHAIAGVIHAATSSTPSDPLPGIEHESGLVEHHSERSGEGELNDHLQ